MNRLIDRVRTVALFAGGLALVGCSAVI